jgi:hypothetical protein
VTTNSGKAFNAATAAAAVIVNPIERPRSSAPNV